LTRTVLVVGSGFIGSSLAKWFSNRYRVRVVDRVQRPVEGPVEFAECDIRDFEALKHAAEGAELLLHTAIVQIPQINNEKRLGYEVNVKGTQNVCEIVREMPSIKGMILTGSWHTIGERNIRGVVNERFGFRPDMVEQRARMYALSKIAQESIVRLFGAESSEKIYGVIRIGTTLGANMPSGTAANIFINQALKGEPLTPYDYSMHRPMLYVHVNDVCRAFESYAQKIFDGKFNKTDETMTEIVNVYYPQPVTILEMAKMVKDTVANVSKGRITPRLKIVRTKQPRVFTSSDKRLMRVDTSKAREFLEIKSFLSPHQAIQEIVKAKLRDATPL
jgi:UDP-glucose 4-epimerase